MKFRVVELTIILGLLLSNTTLAQRQNSFLIELEALKKNAQALKNYSYSSQTIRTIVTPGPDSKMDENHPLRKQTTDLTFGVFNDKHLVEAKCYDKNNELFTYRKSYYNGESWAWFLHTGKTLVFSKDRHRRAGEFAGTQPVELVYSFINLQSDSLNSVNTYPMDIRNNAAWERLYKEAKFISFDDRQFTFTITGTDDYTTKGNYAIHDFGDNKTYLDEVTVDRKTYLPIILKRYAYEANVKGALMHRLEVKEFEKFESKYTTFYYPKTLESITYFPTSAAEQEHGDVRSTYSVVVTAMKSVNEGDLDFSIDPTSEPTLAKWIWDQINGEWIRLDPSNPGR